MKLRIHDRYVLGLFLKILFFCIVGFTVIFILIDVFEKIDSFIDNDASAWDATRYFLYFIPEIVRLTLPVDMLLATMLTLGILGRNNEVVALVAGGVSLVRITLPILFVALLGVAASAVLSEYVVPKTNSAMSRIKRVEIEKKPALDQPVRYNFSYYGKGGYLYVARRYDTRKKELKEVAITFSKNGRIVGRVDAAKAVWQDQRWLLTDGVYSSFEQDGMRTERFRQLDFPELTETPEELARLKPEPEAMNYSELRSYVERVRASGVDVTDYLVDLYTKISYPFTIFIMSLLGVGISASKRKTSLATGFVQTLIIAFAYLVIVGFTEAYGKNQTIPPLLAAWSAPLTFALLSTFFLRRVNR